MGSEAGLCTDAFAMCQREGPRLVGEVSAWNGLEKCVLCCELTCNEGGIVWDRRWGEMFACYNMHLID